MIDRNKLKDLPAESGVYIMLDEFGQILYIGKAKSLKNRVRQYFQNSAKTEKTMLLVQKIADFRYIITNSEIEALVLENNLIKEHKPYYNILLKDDKSYPYIKINLKEAYPQLQITRRLKNDGSKYFGPYMCGITVKETLELVHNAFPVRYCRDDLSKTRRGKRECLNYHIGRCLAPCSGKTNDAEYLKMLDGVIDFLKGSDKEIKKILTEKMIKSSERQEYEIALKCRDSLKILEKLERKQIINFSKDLNLDIFSYAQNDLRGVINYMVVRGGKVLGSDNFQLDNGGGGAELLSEYIMRFYDKNPILADEIIVSEELFFSAELSDFLSQKKGSRIHIITPKAGLRKQLTEMSLNNASDYLEISVTKIAAKETLTRLSVEKLKDALNLPKPPKRIECYDISNISGTDKVASMVVFINGEAAKNMYRRFKIRTVKGADDFKSMREVMERRLNELATGTDVSFTDVPDLIVVDGGKGQLSSVYGLIEPYGISVIGLAKREEEIFVPKKSEPIILERNSLPLTLLQRIRDEAHRFAITYHRTLRNERQTRSNLKNIPGIGDKKARALLIHFKKVENIAVADATEIMKIRGFGEKDAKAIVEHFKNTED